MTGPPGTGKSSLAERAAAELGAPVLGWDWVMASLTGFGGIQGALGQMTHEERLTAQAKADPLDGKTDSSR